MPAYALAELAGKLAGSRIVWLMLPAGPVIDAHLEELREIPAPGDIVIDRGDTRYK